MGTVTLITAAIRVTVPTIVCLSGCLFKDLKQPLTTVSGLSLWVGIRVVIILAGTMMTRGQAFKILLYQQGQRTGIPKRLLGDNRDLVVSCPFRHFCFWQ